MRKHDVRKWLHAILDLLPVIIIPVFMIYSHRHTIDNYSISVTNVDNKDFYQLIEYPSSNNDSYWEYSNFTYSNNSFNSTGSSRFGNISHSGSFVYDSSHTYFMSIEPLYVDVQGFQYLSFSFVDNDDTGEVVANYSVDNVDELISNSFVGGYLVFDDETFDNGFIPYDTILINLNYSSHFQFSFTNIQLFDVSQIFGVGLEPSVIEFNEYLNDTPLPYGTNIISINSTVTLYNDTDIGSQMFYCLYNSVDKYFNMGNVFNLNQVYDWFNSNIFNGNIPPSMFVVWNIVLYEFVMDLLFLLYGLFMWFIDMVEKIMDKPFKSIK